MSDSPKYSISHETRDRIQENTIKFTTNTYVLGNIIASVKAIYGMKWRIYKMNPSRSNKQLVN